MLPATDDVGRHQLRQSFQPQTSGLRFSMSELPRLDDLTWLPYPATDDAHGILKGDFRNGSVEQPPNEIQRGLLPTVGAFRREVTSAGHREVRTRRVSNHQVEPVPDDVEHIALVVRTRHVGGKQVAGDCIMAALDESVADSARVFTRN